MGRENSVHDRVWSSKNAKHLNDMWLMTFRPTASSGTNRVVDVRYKP